MTKIQSIKEYAHFYRLRINSESYIDVFKDDDYIEYCCDSIFSESPSLPYVEYLKNMKILDRLEYVRTLMESVKVINKFSL